MNIRIICLLACAFLIAAPGPGVTAPREDKGNVLRSLASRVGRVLGAASACPTVARPRIKAVAEKITDAIRTSSGSDDEAKSILDLFNASYLEGAGALSTRQNDCSTADRELADLEGASVSAPQVNPVAAGQSAGFATQIAGWGGPRGLQ